jgi:hypothetical protein
MGVGHHAFNCNNNTHPFKPLFIMEETSTRTTIDDFDFTLGISNPKNWVIKVRHISNPQISSPSNGGPIPTTKRPIVPAKVYHVVNDTL